MLADQIKIKLMGSENNNNWVVVKIEPSSLVFIHIFPRDWLGFWIETVWAINQTNWSCFTRSWTMSKPGTYFSSCSDTDTLDLKALSLQIRIDVKTILTARNNKYFIQVLAKSDCWTNHSLWIVLIPALVLWLLLIFVGLCEQNDQIHPSPQFLPSTILRDSLLWLKIKMFTPPSVMSSW